MLAVNVDSNKTQFAGTDGTSGPVVRALPPPSKQAGVYVTFHLGPAQSKEGTAASVPFINGALHLVWTGPSGTKPAPPARRSITRSSPPTAHIGIEGNSGDIEEAIGRATGRLSSAQQQEVRQARSVAAPQARIHKLASTGPVQTISERSPVTVVRGHAVKLGTATQKLSRDAAQIKALCAASNDAPLGLPSSLCKPATTNHP